MRTTRTTIIIVILTLKTNNNAEQYNTRARALRQKRENNLSYENINDRLFSNCRVTRTRMQTQQRRLSNKNASSIISI